MYTGSIAPVSNREDWIVNSPLIDDDGTEVVLTAATIEVWVCQQGFPRSSLLSGSTVDGKITLPTTTSFQWAFTPDEMGVLCAGTYDLFLRVTINSITTQVMAATLPIVEGGPA